MMPDNISLLNFRYSPVKISLIIAALSTASQPARAIEFATGILNMDDNDKVNLKKFERAGYIAPGKYRLSVSLNNNLLHDDVDIIFVSVDGNENARPCLPVELVDTMAIKPEHLNNIISHNGCIYVEDIDSVTTTTNLSRSALNVSVPQAFLQYSDSNWTPPSRWDNGIPGFMLDYDIAASKINYKHSDNTQDYSSYGTAGVNVGPWRIRGNYLEILYAPALRGYAPQVSGIAKTNARVKITQKGRTLYETNVPPGPFVISDLNQAVQGLLDVAVEEEDGSVQYFQVNTASIPFLTRQGSMRYKLFSGKPVYNTGNRYIGPEFMSGEISWGAFNNTSLYGGFIATNQNYQAATAGIGQDLHLLGALSMDVTRAQSKLEQQNTKSGYSYRVNYARQFASTGSQISFMGYRFSDSNYLSMSDYLDYLKINKLYQRDRETYTVMGNQHIPWVDVNTYLSYTHRNYWYGDSSNSMSLSMTRNFNAFDFRNITGTLSVSKTRYRESDDRQIYFGISMPIGTGQQISYDSQYGEGNRSHTVSYYNSSERDRSYRLSAGGRDTDISSGSALVRGSYRQRTQSGAFNVNASQKNRAYRSVSADWNGSVTITPYGAAFSESLGGETPRMLVSAHGVSDVPFNGGNAKTNRFGIAVIPGGSSFESNSYAVDIRRLPENVEMEKSIFQSTLTEGAIGYKSLPVNKGYRVMATITLADGTAPGFGSPVTDTVSGRELGIVGPGGQAYLSGIDDNATAIVDLGNGKICNIHFPKLTGTALTTLLLPCQ
ncbi:fimbrial biogenesis outer membrane usher protein [Klebsiella pneumoniae]|uniref:fimbria/pilus outer membrane usher protein n=1 Tax=Klebsiella pneumoniae TaxID=573 RepID=UPI000FD3A3C8|nr:fimbria/pilus outer membrane usher protein [Klebsiella pneumoniae]RVR37495.1 fimbrial biogenesis outer membrane usher protein [Klebsiella pneumoniae]